MRKSFKKIGTTVTSTVMAAGMVLGPVSSVHAEEIHCTAYRKRWIGNYGRSYRSSNSRNSS